MKQNLQNHHFKHKINMINANELRIGNLVYLDNPKHWPNKKDHIMMVTGLTFRYDKNSGNRVSVSLLDIYNLPFEVDSPYRFAGTIDEICKWNDFLEPIPITEEWLIKLGFEKLNTTSPVYSHINDEMNYKVNLFFIGEGYQFSNVPMRRPLLYIHQLQNLYFALTNQELKIK